jgi:hypothetical protein
MKLVTTGCCSIRQALHTDTDQHEKRGRVMHLSLKPCVCIKITARMNPGTSNFTEHSLSAKLIAPQLVKEFPVLYGTYYHVHESLLNPLHNAIPCFFNILFNIILSAPWSSRLSVYFRSFDVNFIYCDGIWPFARQQLGKHLFPRQQMLTKAFPWHNRREELFDMVTSTPAA